MTKEYRENLSKGAKQRLIETKELMRKVYSAAIADLGRTSAKEARASCQNKSGQILY